MHLGRFNYAAWVVSNYFESNNLIALFDQTITQLQAYISAPTSESSSVFRSKIALFLEACGKVSLDCSAASFKQIILDTGGDIYFGAGLVHSLMDIFEKQSMVPADMLVTLQKFRVGFGKYVDSMDKISNELIELEVEFVSLEDEEYEFGAMFPKELVGNSVDDLRGEMEHLNRLFKSLNELIGKGPTSPSVRNISSSWWQFFIELDYEQIAAVTFAMERIVALYKSNLEIQKLKQETEKNDLGPEIIGLLNNKIDEKLKSGMLAISKELREKFQKNEDDGRCNELEIQLRMELVHIAQRINQGAAYEVRAGLPDKPKKLGAEIEDQKVILEHKQTMQVYEERLKSAQEINSAGVRLASAIDEQSGSTQLLTDYTKLTEGINSEASKSKKAK